MSTFPAFTVKAKTCTAPGCDRQFIPRLPLQRVCGPVCARRVAVADSKAKRAKEKEELKARKEKLKTLSQLEKECRDIVQKIARIRDRNDGCISCHMGPDYRGLWHGSHYRPAGNNNAVQFHLWNIHKSCAQCNKFKGGNLGEYRPRLVEKIGLERVEWLESQTQVAKYTRDYLQRFKVVMSRRCRRLEKRIQAE
jgi:hypothetical protein